MTLKQLKKIEGQTIEFLFRGKYRPFILEAVQDKEPCTCSVVSDEHKKNHLIKGCYQSYFGEVRLNYAYGDNTKREWDGFWTKKIELIRKIK